MIMSVGDRVRFNGKSPWPERIGCAGVVVSPPADGRYPQPAKSEVLVLLDNDPLSTGRRGWSCVADRRSLETDR